MLRAAGDRLIVNDDVFDWDDLPRSVAVFGPGVIGLELGQALHRLGVASCSSAAAGTSARSPTRRCRRMRGSTFARELDLDANADVRAVERDGDARARALSRRATAATARRTSTS